jgi:hypothetical protein
MNRRRYLTVLGVTVAGAGLAAGCIGEDGAPAGDGSATPRPDTPMQMDDATDSATTGDTTATPPPIEVETPAPGECEAPERPDPSTYEGLPDPREYPDPPSAFDVETLTSYLEAYEGAYRYNARLADLVEDRACVKYFQTEVVGSTLWETDDGVVAEVVTTGSYTGATCPDARGTDATGTPTPHPHADFFEQSAHFLVTERFLVRKGTVVECWE